jgi:hypothetical protein
MGKLLDYNFSDKHLWYLVGLIASDGCLQKDGKVVAIYSADITFLNDLKQLLNIRGKVYTYTKRKLSCLQICSKTFYEFLLSIGLTPAKSLTLGKLKIPDEYFNDFLRGEIDGDGYIRKWTNKGEYTEQCTCGICSASYEFANWLKNKISVLYSVNCSFYKETPKKGNIIYRLVLPKLATQKVLKEVYYDGALALKRKANLAKECIETPTRWHSYKGNENTCKLCGRKIMRVSTYCKQCLGKINAPKKHKVIWPTKEKLEGLIKQYPYTIISNIYNVSPPTIKRWLKVYNIPIEYRVGYWGNSKRWKNKKVL